MRPTILPKPDALLQIAFYRARKDTKSVKETNRFRMEKTRALKKIEIASGIIEKRLENAVKEFPSIGKMHAFERELLEATIETEKTKKALGQFSAASRVISKVRREQSKKIFATRKEQQQKIFGTSRQFFGRVSSIVKSLAQSIEVYNEALRRMNELPSIDLNAPTVILAGFPNTGKTTILARLTGAKAKIASYPFTTEKLQLGYFEEHYQKIQVIDTPGLLDRSIEKRNKIEKKAIAAMRHLAKIIVFVLDPTQHSGYSLQEQLNLLGEIKKEFPCTIIVAINKADLAAKEQIEEAEKKALQIAEEIALEGEKLESALRQKICEKIGIIAKGKN